MISTDNNHDHEHHDTSRAAGPSRQPNKPLPLPLDTTSIPHQIIGGIPNSAPPSLSAFATDPQPNETLDVIPTRAGRKLCVRHKQMADQNVNEKLQKSLDNLPTSERQAVTQLWSTFSNAPHARRKLILEGILTMCCFSQLSHLSDSLNTIIRIDPFSLLPREVNLRILGYLDAISLGRAAQVSKSWKALADDDLLWRRMCGQHIERKCEKCGWGLPLLERRRLKVELNEGSPAAAMGVGGHKHGHTHQPTEMVTRAEALGTKGATGVPMSCDPMVPVPVGLPSTTTNGATNGSANGNGLKRSAPSTPLLDAKKVKLDISVSDSEGEGDELKGASGTGGLTREVRLTRPWKTVYCERLVVERNWRKGRCKTTTLKASTGHEDGVMCLQYHTALTNPSYPVLITGSYDRTVRVWNLDTGETVHVLRGHTRAVRALQFDQMLLFTGAMDGTVRMWNWRAGECLRVLEGHTDGVVSLSYNGYLLASGSADSTIQVWNFRTGNKFTLRGHDDWVNSVVLWDGKSSPGDVDPTKIPSFATGPGKRSASPFPVDKDKKQPDIEPGAKLFSASDDGTVKLWDLETQQCIRTFEGHAAQVQSLKVIMVDMSETELAAQHRRQRSLTPPANGFQPASVASPHSPPAVHNVVVSHARALELAPDGFDPHAHRRRERSEVIEPKIYVHSSDGDTHKPHSDDHAQPSTRGKEEKRAMLLTASLDGTVKLWDVETGDERATLFGHIEGVWSVDVDALRIASASHDRTVKVWDRESGKCIHTFTGHRGAVTSLQLSDDMIVSGSDDGDVMVWSFCPNVAPATPGAITALTPNPLSAATTSGMSA